MKHLSKLGLALLLLGFAFACKQASTDEAIADLSTADSTAITTTSSKAAVENKESNRKFVRTADLKFKVKNVAKSTYAIENIVSKHGGFVTFTDLKSTVNEHHETQVCQDSILETTKFTVDNTITMRVPNTQLDTVLTSLAKQVDFLDSRLIKADDVALQLLSNKLAQKRLTKSQQRLEKGIDAKGKKINDIANAEDKVLERETESDDQIIKNLSLEDQVNFSTVTLYLYQRETVKKELVYNEKNSNAYRPNIGLQIWDSLKTGWFMLEGILAFVTQLWALILIGVLGFLGYKRFFKK
jgi:outer membrane lipoprotein-sorting protein